MRWWVIGAGVGAAYFVAWARCRAAANSDRLWHEEHERRLALVPDDDGLTPEEISEQRIRRYNGGAL